MKKTKKLLPNDYDLIAAQIGHYIRVNRSNCALAILKELHHQIPETAWKRILNTTRENINPDNLREHTKLWILFSLYFPKEALKMKLEIIKKTTLEGNFKEAENYFYDIFKIGDRKLGPKFNIEESIFENIHNNCYQINDYDKLSSLIEYATEIQSEHYPQEQQIDDIYGMICERIGMPGSLNDAEVVKLVLALTSSHKITKPQKLKLQSIINLIAISGFEEEASDINLEVIIELFKKSGRKVGVLNKDEISLIIENVPHNQRFSPMVADWLRPNLKKNDSTIVDWFWCSEIYRFVYSESTGKYLSDLLAQIKKMPKNEGEILRQRLTSEINGKKQKMLANKLPGDYTAFFKDINRLEIKFDEQETEQLLQVLLKRSETEFNPFKSDFRAKFFYDIPPKCLQPKTAEACLMKIINCHVASHLVHHDGIDKAIKVLINHLPPEKQDIYKKIISIHKKMY